MRPLHPKSFVTSLLHIESDVESRERHAKSFLSEILVHQPREYNSFQYCGAARAIQPGEHFVEQRGAPSTDRVCCTIRLCG